MLLFKMNWNCCCCCFILGNKLNLLMLLFKMNWNCCCCCFILGNKLNLLLLLFYFEMLIIWKKVICKQQQQQPWSNYWIPLKKTQEMNFKSNHFQIKNENQLTMDFTRNEFKIKTNSNWKWKFMARKAPEAQGHEFSFPIWIRFDFEFISSKIHW
jgi:hypothetical protein